nr:hypothetical protein [Tanacetum cinerariifolium]
MTPHHFISLDEAIAKGDVDPNKVLKQKHGDDKDQVPPLNSPKEEKKKSRKYVEPSKESSTSNESSKGKTLPKSFKTDKSVHAGETVEEPTPEVAMDAEEPILDDVNKLFNLMGDDIVHLVNALHMFTRSIIIKKRVTDVKLVVESYKKKLNVIKPQKEFLEIVFKEPHITSYDLKGVEYMNKSKRKRLMRADELYKFSDKTLKFVCKILHERLQNFMLGYNKDMPKRK